ncbi:hypothetical protein [Amaricoccus solimangrovi]|uniref:Uncharacterized protein n=1 Tax=Amaricoccus solimangrovi TaxID=2589815 RepID=A0A501X176_9RHOB|nr:hypothetical protein [Amaricoccus solimangrovi]TPE53246.1 hypothetical protein FJM51_04300 [Amaricoccus solimangrovi]
MTLPLAARALGSETDSDLIIDGRLAFSEHGLLIALALAERRRCWLAQGLWALLQRFEVIDYPDLADPGEDARALLPRLREWHAVWSATTLLERFCWIGDVLFESHLPPGFDQSAARRSQEFAALLERFLAPGTPVSSLGLCARDSLALAAVNAIAAPVILTLTEPDGPPRMCRMLSAAGLDCVEIEGEQAARLSRAGTGEAPPRPVGLALAAGARLAAVCLLAPRAVAAALDDAPDFEPDDAEYSEERDPWHGASAFWCEVAS